MNTNNLNYLNPGFFALFKGPSGSGKTVAALSWPNIKMYDYDHKMPAIAHKHFPKKSIEFDQPTHWEQIYDEYDRWLKGKEECPFETLLHDSITSIGTMTIRNIGESKGEDIRHLLTSMNKKKLLEPLSYDYYSGEVRFIDWILAASKELWLRPGNPKHMIFTAHIITNESKPNIETKLVTRTRSIVSIGNKAAAIVPTVFDEVYLFGTTPDDSPTARPRHIMTTETCGEDDAKTAFRLPQMIDFTGENLYEILQSNITGSEMFL